MKLRSLSVCAGLFPGSAAGEQGPASHDAEPGEPEQFASAKQVGAAASLNARPRATRLQARSARR